VRPGETADVTLGGFDWTDDLDWFAHSPETHLEVLGPPGEYVLTPPPYWTGPRASIPALPISREVTARIRVDAKAAPGLARWQIANANGASPTAVFLVSRDTEIVEARSRDLPQRLPALPVAVSGRLSRLTEVDRYELLVPRDGLISVDLMARRLGSKFHGQIEVRDGAGRRVADLADTQGFDGALTFAAKGNELYTVSLHDTDFRGDRSFVYRLAFTSGPRVVTTLPARGRRGETTEVEFVGYGLATGAAALETVRQAVTFPSDPAVASHRHPLTTPAGPIEVAIPLSDLAEFAAAAAITDASGQGHPLTAPCGITGRAAPGAADLRYVWESAENQSWTVSLQSQRLGAPLDLSLRILDSEGKVLAESDDAPGTLDPELSVTSPKPGPLTAVIHTLTPRTGRPDEAFRLEVRPRPPGFTLRVPQTVDIPLGGKASIKVLAERAGGLQGPISVTADALPRGIAPVGDWTITEGKSEATLTIEAAADADVTAAMISLRGAAAINGQNVAQDALAPAAGPLCQVPSDDALTPRILLAVTMTPPFEVKILDRERQREVHRGTTYPAELEIVRHAGFAGPMQIAMSAQQDRDRQGVRGPLLPVPAPDTAGLDGTQPQRVLYPCTMPEWLGTELTRRIVVHGVAGVPDPKGRVRFLTRAGDARITMIMEGALLKLHADEEPRSLRAGDAVEIPVTVSRSVKLPLEATIELVVPDEAAGLLEAAPLTLPAGSDAGTLVIRSRNDVRLHGGWTLGIRATSLQEGRWPVISVAPIKLVFD